MTPSGIEPATYRIVAQHLNHCATAVPILFLVFGEIIIHEECKFEVPNKIFSCFPTFGYKNISGDRPPFVELPQICAQISAPPLTLHTVACQVAAHQLLNACRNFGKGCCLPRYSMFLLRLVFHIAPPLWSSGQSFWLQTEGSRVRFPALPDFLSSSGYGTGSTQPREVN